MSLTINKPAPAPTITVVEASAPPDPSKPGKKQMKTKTDKDDPKFTGTATTIAAALQKLKGSASIIQGNKAAIVPRIPTGIFEVDFYLGGGFPCGRYTIVYGPESSGKTNLALCAVAQAQRKAGPCNKAVWVDVEQCWDDSMAEWAASLGVDIENLIVCKPAYGEEAVDMVDAFLRAEDVAILVVDSLAPMVATKEIEQSAENYDVGTSALLTKRMSNKIAVAFGEERRKDHYPCVILINQIRFKIGVMFGNPETMPGGEAVKFLASMRIRMSATNKVVKAVNPDVHSFKETHIIVKKAKIPVLSNDFKFDFCVLAHDKLKCGESASFNTVLSYLKQMSSLKKTNNGYTIEGLFTTEVNEFTGKQDIPMLFPTQADIGDMYYENIDFRLALQKKVIDAFAGKAFYVAEELAGPPDLNPGIPKGQEMFNQ
jgi:recombination protein RecA